MTRITNLESKMYKELVERHRIGYNSFKDVIQLDVPSTANFETHWKGSDTHDRFIARKPSDEKFMYWKNKSITYKYNDLGFRSNIDYGDIKEGDVFLGCSFTEGVGLPLELTWGYKLAKHLNIPFINLGIGGKGIGVMLQNLIAFSRQCKINRVFLFVPPLYRYDFVISDNDLFKTYLGPLVSADTKLHTLHSQMATYWTGGAIEGEYLDFFQAFLFGSKKQAINYSINHVLAIKGYCDSIGAKLFYSTHEEYHTKEQYKRAMSIPDTDCPNVPARDQHWNAKLHHLIFTDLLLDNPELVPEEPVKKPKRVRNVIPKKKPINTRPVGKAALSKPVEKKTTTSKKII